MMHDKLAAVRGLVDMAAILPRTSEQSGSTMTAASRDNAMPAKSLLLEIAVNSLASALAAQDGGANRVELCAALEVGGLTPSHGLIALVRERLSIPVHVLVRPRPGDFICTDEEHATVLADIAHCVATGCDGVVMGALTEDGDVDTARCREWVAAAGALDKTFHRAIDVCRDPAQALEDIIALGFNRVLSSGGAANALQGAARLRALMEQADGRIVIMPGAGIHAGNIAEICAAIGAREFHASAKHALPSRMRFAPADALGMGDGENRSDVEEVRRLVEVLRGVAL
jgi:copper homeostasis protein